MKILVLIGLLSFAAMAEEIQTKYFCQDIQWRYVDGSRNGQPMFMKLNLIEGSYESDAKVELIDKNLDPQSTNGLKRNCQISPSVNFDTKNLICTNDDVFAGLDAVLFMSFKIDRFTGAARDTFLVDFVDTDASSNVYTFRLNPESRRQFYCRKIVE